MTSDCYKKNVMTSDEHNSRFNTVKLNSNIKFGEMKV